MADEFDSQEFYELMQTYRTARITDQAGVCRAVEAVKEFCRAIVEQRALTDRQRAHALSIVRSYVSQP